MTSEEFLLLPWHDAHLLDVRVDRSSPGHSDTVELDIKWPDDHKCKMIFEECYFLDIKMNFGIIADETIRDVECVESCDEIVQIRNDWSEVSHMLEKLKLYKFNTNSTNSTIKIFALSLRVQSTTA